MPSGAGQGALPGRVAESDVKEAEGESCCSSMSGSTSATLTPAVEAASSLRRQGSGGGRDGSCGRVVRSSMYGRTSAALTSAVDVAFRRRGRGPEAAETETVVEALFAGHEGVSLEA